MVLIPEGNLKNCKNGLWKVIGFYLILLFNCRFIADIII